MASSRVLPLDYNTSTFGGVTRKYQSLPVWEAATDNNLVAATKGEVLDCYADSASFDQKIVFSGATTNSDYYRVIRAAAGHECGGLPGAGFVLNCTEDGSASCLRMIESYACVYDICNIHNANNNSTRFCADLTDNIGGRVVGCVLKALNAGSGAGMGLFSSQAITTYVVNNLAYECKTRGINIENANTGYIYNNTIVDNVSVGLRVTGTTIVVNNIYQDNDINLSGTPTTDTTNVTSGVVFQNAAADNYLLDPSDAAAQGQGTDLSGDANYPFNDDTLGNTRVLPWTVGFHDLAAEVSNGLLGNVFENIYTNILGNVF